MSEPSTTQRLLAVDPIVWRDELQAIMRVSGETVRRWLKEDRLPKPDIYPTRKTMGWKLSTLRAAGFEFGVGSTDTTPDDVSASA